VPELFDERSIWAKKDARPARPINQGGCAVTDLGGCAVTDLVLGGCAVTDLVLGGCAVTDLVFGSRLKTVLGAAAR
jgi:hypothetical protein